MFQCLNFIGGFICTNKRIPCNWSDISFKQSWCCLRMRSGVHISFVAVFWNRIHCAKLKKNSFLSGKQERFSFIVYSVSFFSLSNLKLERAKDQRQLSILSVMNVILVQFYLLIVSNKPAISRLSFDPWLSYLPRSNGVGNLSATESRWFFFQGQNQQGMEMLTVQYCWKGLLKSLCQTASQNDWVARENIQGS